MVAGRPGPRGPSAVLLAVKEDSACAPELVIIHLLSTEENTVLVTLRNQRPAQDLHALSPEAGATGTAGLRALLHADSEDVSTERESAIIPNPHTVEPSARDRTQTPSFASLNTARSMEDGAVGQNMSSIASLVERVVSELAPENVQIHSQCTVEPNVTEMPQTCSQLNCLHARSTEDGPAGHRGQTPVSLVETEEFPSDDEHAPIPSPTMAALTVMASTSKHVL
jgi:hypothetical protein